MPEFKSTDQMVDIRGPKNPVEIGMEGDKLWITVDGECVLRIQGMEHRPYFSMPEKGESLMLFFNAADAARLWILLREGNTRMNFALSDRSLGQFSQATMDELFKLADPTVIKAHMDKHKPAGGNGRQEMLDNLSDPEKGWIEPN